MIKAAKMGGNTTRREQCSKYRKIALKLGFEEKDIPIDVKNSRMQRFDHILNFTRRACNQKKSNLNEKYDIDRLSRSMKDVIKKNIDFACKSVEC